ncbi:VF530 family protein [Chromobacterium haemolyticum]|nr:VF530 family protein [Chromobacterium haemolyticum]
MSAPQPKNPTHGVTLEQMLNQLVGHYGWPELGRRIQIRCFNHDPSVKSSLAFLRRTHSVGASAGGRLVRGAEDPAADAGWFRSGLPPAVVRQEVILMAIAIVHGSRQPCVKA